MTPISESELVIPALKLLAESSNGLNTSQLISGLEDLLHPSGDDLTILEGRRDTKFSQKVRNLTSHNTLVNRGYAVRADGRNQPYRITHEGRVAYLRHQEALRSSSEYSLEDAEDVLRNIAEDKEIVVIDDVVIREGQLGTRTSEYRVRSQRLRDAAVDYYSDSGRIPCHACEFDFSSAYDVIGQGYVQIHHLIPVSFLSGEPLDLEEALANVRPLCANCHQMVHTKRPPLPIEEIKSRLRVSYTYST